jgi:hypothetical protein
MGLFALFHQELIHTVEKIPGSTQKLDEHKSVITAGTHLAPSKKASD